VDQFRQFMADPDYPASAKPRDWKGPEKDTSPTPDCPVQRVSWEDAVLFCNWLSRREGRRPCYRRQRGGSAWVRVPGANGYRLLTDAEWEYACQARSKGAFAFGNDAERLTAYGFHRLNSHGRAWPVGSKLPNGWGLFDMHGNVAEWCQDVFGPLTGAAVDPQGPPKGAARVYRGGGWYCLHPLECRSALRLPRSPQDRNSMVGFRVACSATAAR
jgi:formylglycine-generating enzyme required for sulfatase activity